MGGAMRWLLSSDRVRFWGRALAAGSGWLNALVGMAGTLIFVAALLGVAIIVPVVVPRHSLWLLSLAIVVLVVAVLGEGAFRVWRGDRATPTETVPKERVSDEHRVDLQQVARRLIEGVEAWNLAHFVQRGESRRQRAPAFREHFPELASEVDEWNREIDKRAELVVALGEWIEKQPTESVPAGHFSQAIATRAVMGKSDLPFERVTGWLQLDGYTILPLYDTAEADREATEAELRELLERAKKQPERARFSLLTLKLEDRRGTLLERLEVARDKDVIYGLGDCKLCR